MAAIFHLIFWCFLAMEILVQISLVFFDGVQIPERLSITKRLVASFTAHLLGPLGLATAWWWQWNACFNSQGR